jgi:two-component system nitrogen regulation response regulator GlnG
MDPERRGSSVAWAVASSRIETAMTKARSNDLSTAVPPQDRRGASGAERAPALTVVAHPTAGRVGDRALLEGLLAGRAVQVSRNEPDFAAPGSVLGTSLDDPFLSRKPMLTVSVTDAGRVRVAVAEGARVDVGAALGADGELAPDTLEDGVPIALADRVVVLLHLAPTASEPADRLGMIGAGTGLQRVRRDIERVADLDVPVLIRGETGTGKELVAQAIHRLGPRRERRFVGVNLAALPRELAAAQLFGARKGAYTGASGDRDGFFQTAAGGTLFLDEIGEAPPEVQALLLRALETGEIYPVGAQQPVTVDVRVLAATDADLEARIRDGSFKAPLLHRLAGYEISLPSLRRRRDDIGRLFHHFARLELGQIGETGVLDPGDPHAEPWLPAALAMRLVRHAWPGNIRELRNLTRRLVIASRGRPAIEIDPRVDELLDASPDVSPLPADASPAPAGGAAVSPAATADAPAAPAAGPRRRPGDVSEDELVAAMRAAAWDLKAAADVLGIPRSSMYDLIARSGRLRTAGDLTAEEITACFHACDGDLDAMTQRLEVSRRALQRRVRELGLRR